MNSPHSSPHPALRERRQRVQSVETGMAVLKGLASLGGRAGLTALAEHVAQSPAKVHRYLVSLVQEGLVMQDPASQQYVLGLEALLIGLAAMRQVDPVRVAEPALVRLREGLGVTCFVAVMGNQGPTIVRFEESGLPISINARVGSVMSLLWSATGRLFLGFLDESRMRAMAEREWAQSSPELRKTLTGKDPIGKLRKEVQAAGCAVVRDTYLQGISAVAAPLLDHAGHLCAALVALGMTGGAMDFSAQGTVARALCAQARETSRLLGYVEA